MLGLRFWIYDLRLSKKTKEEVVITIDDLNSARFALRERSSRFKRFKVQKVQGSNSPAAELVEAPVIKRTFNFKIVGKVISTGSTTKGFYPGG